MIIKNGLVWEESGSFLTKDLHIDSDTHRIAMDSADTADDTIIDASGLYVIPGLVDIHIHGAMGCDFSDGSAEGLLKIAKYLRSCGVTAFCPTSMTLPENQLLTAFASTREIPDDNSHAFIAGIHMEGPFLSPEKKGAQKASYLRAPDIDMFRRLSQACDNKIRIITIAPELSGADAFIREFHSQLKDLIFPHHENEIAQSECCNDKIFAKYWMHNAFLNIDNRKMSKSLGNFRTVREISEQYDLQVLRFFMLNAHYRSPLNFSADLMEAAKNALERITDAAANLKDRKAAAQTETATDAEKELLAQAQEFVKKFEEAMDDDFNTADALAAIFELVKFANTNVSEASSAEFAGALLDTMVKLCDVLGLKAVKTEEILDKEIEDLIAERQEARKAKNFARADEIRDELLAKGIILKDTREGVKWKRA